MTAYRATCRASLALALCLTTAGPAGAVATVPEVVEGGATRTEVTEIQDAAGHGYRVETRTDPYGWRTRAIHPIDPVVTGSADAPAQRVPTAPTLASDRTGWRSIGPDGGDVLTLAVSPVHPQLVLAGLDLWIGTGFTPRAILYRSTDGGRHWSAALSPWTPNHPYARVYHIAFGSDGTAYAASNVGVWASADDGETWHRLPDDANVPPVRTVAVEPGAPLHIWIGCPDGTVSRSLDGGASWQAVPIPGALQPAGCRAITFDAARPGVVFVGLGDDDSGNGQLWVSENGGATWDNRSGGMPNAPVNVLVHDGTRLLLGSGAAILAHEGGLFATTDDGRRWTYVVSSWPVAARPRVVRDIAIDPTNPCVIWLATPTGLNRSTNCGTSWSFSAAGSHENTYAALVLPGDSGVLEGCEAYGVRRLGDSGSFEPSSDGLQALDVSSVAANPLDPHELAAGFQSLNSGGVYTSRDGGTSWKLEPTLRARINRVLFDRSGTLYAISNGPTTINAAAIFKRWPGGGWSAIGPATGPLFGNDLRWARVSPHDPGLILCGGGDFSNHGFASAVWRTADGGAHWTQVVRADANGFSSPDGTLLDDGTDRVWLVTTSSSPGEPVLRSEDRGATWSSSWAGLPAGTRPWGFGPVPGHPDRVFLTHGTQGQLERSDDGGRAWHQVSPDAPLDRVMVDPHDPLVLYGTRSDQLPNGVLVRSRDAGVTFEPFSQGMELAPFTHELSPDASACSNLLAATSAGVFTQVIDVVPPDIDTGPAPEPLWPPNHHMVEVHVPVSLTDACDSDPTFALVSIECNEPLDPADVEGADLGQPDTDFRLRATRSGAGEGRTYTVTYRGTDASGNSVERSVVFRVPHDASGTRAGQALDSGGPAGSLVTGIRSVFPSPFANSTTVGFDLADAARVRLQVFDLRGSVVRTLADGFEPAGRHQVEWNGRDDSGDALANGVYWLRFDGPGRPQVRRIVHIR